MKLTPKVAAIAAAAALTLPIGLAKTANAVELTPCSAEDLAGNWLVLYEVKEQEYCILTIDEAGAITNSACHDFERQDIGQMITGAFTLDASCAVSGALQFSKVEDDDDDDDDEEKARKGGKGNKGSKGGFKTGKYGPFNVKAQLSEDRSTLVGVFDFKKDRLSHLVGQRTQ